MPPPVLEQRIVSSYDDAGVQAHLRALREIRAAQREQNQAAQAAQRQERERTNATRRTASEQQKAMRLIRQTVKEARAEFNLLNEQSRKNQISAAEFDRAVQKLSANTERNLQRIRGAMSRVGSGAALEFKNAEVALARFTTRTQIEMTGMSRLRTRIGAGVGDALEGRTSGVYSQLGLITRGLAVLRGGFQATFAGVAVAAVIKAATALDRFTQKSRQFQREMAAVAIAGDASAASMQRLERGVIDVASRVGGGRISDFTQALNDIRQAGFDGAEGLEILEVSARSAVGGVTDVATAADLLTSVLAAYKLPASEAAHVSDLLFQAAKDGKTTLPEMARSIGQVAPVAAAANVSLEELLASVATLTASGLSTSESMTRTRAVITGIIDPAKEAAAVAESLGLEFNAQALASKGLAGVLADVERATGGNVETMAKLFTSTEALEAAVQLAGRQADAFARNLEGMRQSTGAATEAYQEMKRTTDFLSDTLRNRFDAILIGLSAKTLPAYNAALRQTLHLMDQLRDPSERLLGVLKEMSGVDPQVLRRLELQVNAGKLREQQAALEAQLEGRTFRFTTERQREAALTGPVINFNSPGRYTRMNADDLADRQLQEIRERITRSIEALNGAIDAGVSRARVTSMMNEYERQLADLDEVIRLRTELTAVNQALAQTESDLAQKTAPIPVPRMAGGLFDQGAILSGMFAAGATSAPADVVRSISERVEALKKERDAIIAKGEATARLAEINRELHALEESQRRLQGFGLRDQQTEAAIRDAEKLVRTWQDAAKVLQADPEVRGHLTEILQLDKEILDLEDRIARVRGTEAEAGLRAMAEEKKARQEALQAAMLQREEMQRFADTFQGLRPKPVDAANLIEVVGGARLTEQVNAIIEQTAADVQEINLDLEFGKVSPEDAEKRIRTLTAKAKEHLRELYAAFKSLLPPEARAKIEQFLSGVEDETSEAAKAAAKAAEAFKEMVGMSRAMYRLADALGVVSEEMEAIAGGALEALDSLSKLKDLQARKAAGENISGTAMATAGLGFAAGFIGAFTSWAGIMQQRHAEERQAHREHMQRLLDLQRALKEYARALEDARESLLGGGVVGSGHSRAEIEAAQGIAGDMGELFREGGTGRPGRGRGKTFSEAEQMRFRSWMQDLNQTGLFDFDVEEYFNTLLAKFGGDWQQALQALLYGGRGAGREGITSILDDVGEQFGELTKDIEGAQRAFEDAQRYFGKSAAEALGEWSRYLLDNVEGISEDARKKLERVQEIAADGTISEEERKELQAIAAWFASQGVQLGDLFTDAQDREIADTILAGLAGLSSEDGEFTKSVQIARSITEIQANELVALTENGLYEERRQTAFLSEIVGYAAEVISLLRTGRRGADPLINPRQDPISVETGAVLSTLTGAIAQVRAPRQVPVVLQSLSPANIGVSVNGLQVTAPKPLEYMTEADWDRFSQKVGSKITEAVRGRSRDPFNPLGK